MAEMNAEPVKVREFTIEAVVIRKDGTREDLGVISRMEAGPKQKRPWWRTKNKERE